MTPPAHSNLSEFHRPVAPTTREAELELDLARHAFLAARTPYARRKALRRLEAAKARLQR